jgi:hypothetical protein
VKKLLLALFAAETSDPKVRATSIALISAIVTVAITALRASGVV